MPSRALWLNGPSVSGWAHENASRGEGTDEKSQPKSIGACRYSWDSCSENSLAADGLDAIPYETLEASGIARDVADKLNYRNLTPADVEDALDYSMTGCWRDKYTSPDGSDVLVDGRTSLGAVFISLPPPCLEGAILLT